MLIDKKKSARLFF